MRLKRQSDSKGVAMALNYSPSNHKYLTNVKTNIYSKDNLSRLRNKLLPIKTINNNSSLVNLPV